jgi:hypothetical protein
LAEIADERLEVVECRRAVRQHAEHVDVQMQARERARRASSADAPMTAR